MKPNTTPSLPGRVDSLTLLKHLKEGEPVVIVKLIGVGNSAPYDFRDKGTRSYVFRWDNSYGGHIVRIPLSLWQANKGQMAHEIMDQRRMPHSMIVLLEMPVVVAKCEGSSTGENTIYKPQEVQAPAKDATPANTFPEMGAADTSESVRNVVGLDVEPTAAPAEGSTESAEQFEQRIEGQNEGLLQEEAATVSDMDEYQLSTPVAEAMPPIHAQAFDLVEPPKRIKALAALMGVEEPALRAAIDNPESKVEIVNPGWVRRKA